MTEAAGTLTVRELLDFKRERLQLELLTEDAVLDRAIEDSDISSPGLALTGFTARVPPGRKQVFGETEMTYLETLAP